MDELQKQITEAGKVLTDQQRLFVREYMIDLNGTQAAIRAGYAEKTAASRASRLLRDSKIRRYRDLLMQERFEAIGVTKHNIAAEVWEIYRKCTQKEPVLVWDTEAHAWVESGEWRFDVKGALKALDMLNGMLPEMNGSDDDDSGGLEAMLSGGGREF